MSRLFLPPTVARELLDERARYEADVTRACHSDHVCEQWNRELARLDPLLRMMRAPETEVVGTPLVPGHYHLIRINEGAPASVTPIRGPDGEFIYPPGRLLEQIKSMDLQDTRVERMRERTQRVLDERLERDKERLREERQREVLEKWWAASRTQVTTNTTVPWTQNHAGRRGARKKSRADS